MVVLMICVSMKMSVRLSACVLFCGALSLSALWAGPIDNSLDQYDVVWNTPSDNSAGSMPIGNGEVGMNVWVEPGGDLRFYISRSDSYSEICRQLKVGAVRLKITPNPFMPGKPFLQRLHLRSGVLEIQGMTAAGPLKLNLWVDSEQPVINVIGESAGPVQVRLEVESWRTEQRTLTGGEAESAKTMRSGDYTLTESADVFGSSGRDNVWWYHRNEASCVPFTLKQQGIDSLASLVEDPLLHRTFGALVTGSAGLEADGNRALQSTQPLKQFNFRIATHSAITDSAEAWQNQIHDLDQKDLPLVASFQRTQRWWTAFWDRSWIFVHGDSQRSELPLNDHTVRLCCNSQGGETFTGSVSRATLYGHVLTDKEVESLAATKPDQAIPSSEDVLVHSLFQDASSLAAATGNVTFSNDGGVNHAVFAGGSIEFANTEHLDFKNGFTFEAWINPDENASGRLIDKMTVYGSDGFLVDIYPGKCVRLIEGQNAMNTGETLVPGQWQHVAVSFDPEHNVRRIYLDGKLIKSEGKITPELDAEPPSRVTRAYILQRWMLACAGRGTYPIKYNGSIFTVDSKWTDSGEDFNPDWRRWGDGFWWQNTRLPYGPMVANGDYDLMLPLFHWFERGMAFSKARTKLYWDADGFTIPETTSIFYAYANDDYGWNRDGKKPGDIDCGWWKYCWQQSLELTNLMIDYYEHTGDRRFLREELIPVAHETLSYFDSRFKRDAQGKLILDPTQSAESYWHDVINDMPCVAGLNTVPDRLLNLAGADASPDERALWERMKAAAPPLPTHEKNGLTCISPAEKYNSSRNNCENPELYGVYPFRCFQIGKPNIEWAINGWQQRDVKVQSGWPYDSQSAAILGLTNDAQQELLARVANSHVNFRFPVMWGPNFDWLPDQCHGGNLMITLQSMIMQTDGRKIYLLPAWPKTWDVEFKLHAPFQTTVEGRYKGGTFQNIVVTPESRKADLILPPESGAVTAQ